MGENFNESVDKFILELKDYKHTGNKMIFNPWADCDPKYDLKNAPDIRCNNLREYLISRKGAKFVLIAEAPGYQGCHFSGIPMTSERLFTKKYGLGAMQRSSDKKKLKEKRKAITIQKKGFTEPTATMIWEFILGIKELSPTDFVLWNAFPFHPYEEKQLLSNRKPSADELRNTHYILKNFLELFENAKKIPIGNVAAKILNRENTIRHPANGGKRKFEKQMQHVLSSFNLVGWVKPNK